MINRYIIAAALLAAAVIFGYFFNFSILAKQPISDQTDAWGQLGDYVGGILNPIFGFISLIFLIKSLKIQNETNNDLRREIATNEKNERLRSFETLFFNMIETQKSLFEKFQIRDTNATGTRRETGPEAFLQIEREVEQLRAAGATDEQLSGHLDEIDNTDQIFSITRYYYILVKTISERLSDQNGFSHEERRNYFITLINFTDFSMLRLIMMSMQFMDYQSTDYLKTNTEFTDALTETNISYNLY
ncbi:hypothetical protein SB9_05200 [Pseudomonas oryzihabitans]|nr:hypothetical protein SB9_05200 [Pseudomonas psychrotolerans]